VPDRLEAITRACRGGGIAAEVVLACPRGIGSPPLPASAIPVRLVHADSRLVPVLWGAGIAAARGEIVALTTTQFRVRPDWASSLLAAFDDAEVVGAGGSIATAAGSNALTRAVFLIRYSEHMARPGAPPPRDIAGDNAAYRRAAVLDVCPDVARGFWEVDVHRLMRARGGVIAHVPAAVAEFHPELSLLEMLANRFVHGSHFGAYRVSALRWPRWRAVAVTPLVPLVLIARIFGRVRRAGGPLLSTCVLLPAMLPLLAAWAAGEARGAIAGPPHDA
jgi:hypothetical protein